MSLSESQLAELKTILQQYEAAVQAPTPRSRMGPAERAARQARDDAAWRDLLEGAARLGVPPSELDRAAAQAKAAPPGGPPRGP